MKHLLTLLCVLCCLMLTSCHDSRNSRKPSLPIEVKISEEPGEVVLNIRNQSAKDDLSCSLYVNNEDGTKQEGWTFTILPRRTKEIGTQETGWHFSSGDKITICAEGYENYEFTIK